MRRRRKSLGFARKRRSIHINWEYLPVIGKWSFKIAVVCLLAFVYVWYFGQRVSTIGDSMNPVLENGDVVLINRIVYNATSPKRGDIIAFKPKGNENAHYYIKRIVGLPGETVEIIENSIYINGKKIEEDYKTTDIDDVGIASEEITLGGDEYFVLGDNRENSEDSRNADVGNVKRDYIYGEVWFTVSPRKNIGFVG
ncbi:MULTISPECIES: signal peptidase I [Extibacter]|uniref:signal peptidase I n=1 Tax=Extibacter TaxID=1918452 RepID=UPI001AA10D1B|nr:MULTISPECIES: signal peptidase I [Extibacter]MBO1719762.1 signal peptidase I [Extibacter sp. GGCC_0201]MCB6203393.1 signal peptidase I [Extibacter muris]MCQ4664969.1 signal peptidase I [Extibacter muris]MCQ4694334.1 signal peptidase I [Extibacter muris]